MKKIGIKQTAQNWILSFIDINRNANQCVQGEIGLINFVTVMCRETPKAIIYSNHPGKPLLNKSVFFILIKKKSVS